MEERERGIACNEAVFHEAKADRMTPQAYEEHPAVPAHFAVLPGHEAPDVEQVVARRDGYDVVKKDEGIARRIAEVN